MSHHHGIQTSTVVEVGLGLLVGSMISDRQRETGESYGRAMVGVGGEITAALFALVGAVLVLGVLGYMLSLFPMHPFITIGFLLVFVGVPVTILWWAWRKTAGPVTAAPVATAPDVAPELPQEAYVPPFTSRIPRYPARGNVAPRRG